MFGKRRKENKWVKRIEAMSDEEFLDMRNKLIARSCIYSVLGVCAFIGCVVVFLIYV